jgi:mRNA interferase RelE/StbE
MAPSYAIVIQPAAARVLKKLTPDVGIPIKAAIEALATNPRPHGVDKLTDSDSTYRIRVGSYRILYTIEDRILRVTVVDVGHRRDVYR